MVREYHTTRHTTVTTSLNRRTGRPRTRTADPRGSGTFDVIAADGEFAIIDACVPVTLARIFQQMFQGYSQAR